MNKELALSIIQLLSALDAIGASDSKLPDYLVDEIQNKIDILRKIVLERTMNTEEFLEQQKGNVIDAINETQNIEGLRDYFMPEPGAVASINGWYGGYPTICSINGAVLPVGMALYPHAPARLPLQPPHTTPPEIK